jgi:hypothetical protein
VVFLTAAVEKCASRGKIIMKKEINGEREEAAVAMRR